MDLNNLLSGVVDNLVKDIMANVSTHVDTVIVQTIDTKLKNYDYNEHIKNAVNGLLEKKINEYQVDHTKLEARIVEKINSTIESVQASTVTKMTELIDQSIKATDFERSMSLAVGQQLSDRMREFVFPESSIAVGAINFGNTKISGNYISGGVIENFSSTGIDDRTTAVALTLLDQATVVENNLFTKDLTVQGNLVVNGTIPAETDFYQRLCGDVSKTTMSNINDELLANFSKIVFDKILREGIDLNTITVNGNEIIQNNQLGTSIVGSNLQKLGTLKELQVQGESLLSETLYTTQRRVGINTIEPSASLSIWDNEVEINVCKKRKDTGLIGTPRNQNFVVSANGHDNLIAMPDGSVQINSIVLGAVKISSSISPPNFVSDKGHIVFNANPSLGGPLGWICLGSANWANFGIID
jgi:hypothetical protein